MKTGRENPVPTGIWQEKTETGKNGGNGNGNRRAVSQLFLRLRYCNMGLTIFILVSMCMCLCCRVGLSGTGYLAFCWSIVCCRLPVGSWMWSWCRIVGCCCMPAWYLVMSNITYSVCIPVTISRASCLKWLHVFFRLKLSILDCNRQVPNRYVPFPISHNIGFVFPSAFSVPVPVPNPG